MQVSIPLGQTVFCQWNTLVCISIRRGWTWKCIPYTDFIYKVTDTCFWSQIIHFENDAVTERTEVFYGGQNVLRKTLQSISNTRHRFDVCIDHTRPYLAFEIQEIKESLVASEIEE